MTVETEVFKADLEVLISGIFDGARGGAVKQLDALSAAAERAKKALGVLSNVKIGTDISSSVTTAEKAVTQSAAKMQAAVTKSSNVQQEKITQLTKRFDDIGRAGENSVTSLSTRLRGLSLAISQPGARLQGLREAMAGTASAGNVFTRTLDRVARQGTVLGRIQDKLARQIDDIATAADSSVRVLNNQLNTFRRLEKAELGSSDAADELDKQLTRVSAALRQVKTTAATGGDIARPLARARTEVQALEQEYEHLRRTGIIPAGSESDKAFKAIIAEAKNTESSLQAIAVRYKAQKDEIKKVTAAQKEQAKAAGLTLEEYQKQNTLFGRMKQRIAGLFSGLKEAEGDVKNTTKAVKGIEGSLEKASKAASLFKSVFFGSFLGSLSGNFIANVVEDALRDIPAQIVGLASRSEESMAKFGTVFGDAADATESDLDRLAKVIGRSQLELKETAAGYQDTFVPLGFARDQAAEMSKQLVALTSDVASFNNKLDTDVAADFQSALVGNTETVRKYGIVITDTILSQELMRLGVEGGVTAATEQQKVLARLNLIFQGTTDAQLDAVRTSGSWANQTRRLAGEFQNLAIFAGQQLLPALTPFLGILNTIVTNVGPIVVTTITNLSSSILEFASSLSGAVQNALNGTIDLGSNLSTFVGFVLALFEGQWGSAWQLFLLTIDDAIAYAIDSITGLVESGFDWGFAFIQQLSEGIIAAAEGVLDAVFSIAESIASMLAPGSPPETGPLSTIDKWAKGLVEVFDGGFENAEFKNLQDSLAEIQEQIDIGIITDDEGLRKTEGLLRDLAEDARKAGDLEKAKELANRANLIKDEISVEKSGRVKAAKAEAAAVGKIGAASRKNTLKKEIQTAKEIYDNQISLLEAKRDAGILTEEEYLRARISAEKKFADASAKEGNLAVLEEAGIRVQELQAQLDSLKPTKIKKSDLVGDFDLDLPDLFKKAIDEGGVAKTVTSAFSESFTSSLAESFDKSKSRILAKVKALSTDIKDAFISSFKLEELDTVGVIALATIGTIVAALAAPVVIAGVVAIGGAIGGLLSSAVALAPIIAVVAVILLNWDKILPVITGFVDALAGKFDEFIDRLGGAKKATQKFNKLLDSVKRIAVDVGDAIGELFTNLFSGEGAGVSFSGFFDSLSNIDTSSLSESLQGIFTALFPVIQSGVSDISSAIMGMVPPELVETWNGITESIRAFFQETQTGQELVLLFQELVTAFNVILLENKELFVLLGTILAVVGALVADIVVSAFQALVDVLPYLDGAIAGIIMGIRGAVQVMEGFVLIIRAVIATVIDLVTGSDTAGALWLQAWAKIKTGLLTLWQGIIQIIINAGAAIITFIVSFAGNMVANIAMFMGEGGKRFAEGIKEWIATFASWGDDIITSAETTLSQIFFIISQGIDAIIQLFVGLWDELVGHSIIPDMFAEIIATFSTFDSDIASLVGEITKNIVSSFINLGAEIVGGIVQGIQENIGSIGEALGGIFGGDAEGGALKIGALQNIFSTITGGVQAAGGALQGGMPDTTGFTGFLSGIFGGDTAAPTEGNQLIALEQQTTTSVTNIQTAWQNLAQFVINTWGTAMLDLITGSENVGTAWVTAVTTINNALVTTVQTMLEVIGRIVDIGNTFEEARTDSSNALDGLKEALRITMTVIDEVIAKVGDLEAALNRAASARGSAVPTASERPGSFAEGAWKIMNDGMAMIHKKEMIVPAEAAGSLRNFLTAIDLSGIGAVTPSVATPAVASTQTFNEDNSQTKKEVNVYANYAETQSPMQVKDDVLLALQLIS